MRLRKLTYFLTPPLVYRMFDKIYKKAANRATMDASKTDRDVSFIKNFRKQKLNYFFQEQLVDEFCDLFEEHFDKNPPINTKKKENQCYLDELVENGFCKIKGVFTKEQIRNWHDSIYPTLSEELNEFNIQVAQHGIASGEDIVLIKNNKRFCYDLRSGIIRQWSISGVDAFKFHLDINDICNSYLSGKATDTDVYADFKGVLYSKDANLQLHADNIFRNIKVFLPLKPVTEKNAPFIYHKKSHRLGEWRLLKDFLEFTNYNKKYYSSFTHWGDIEMARFSAAYPELSELESIVTAEEGDVIIADTRGIHGGSLLQEDYRLQLGLSFSMQGDFHPGYFPQRILALSRNV